MTMRWNECPGRGGALKMQDEVLVPDYMNGDCHVFAVALARVTGFSFLILLDESEEYPSGVFSVNHVYALDTTGIAYDFHGSHSEAEIVEQWMHPEISLSRPGVIRVTTERDLWEYVEMTKDGWDKPLSNYGDDDVRKALLIAADRLGSELPALRSFTADGEPHIPR
jgi:hypothetical protein